MADFKRDGEAAKGYFPEGTEHKEVLKTLGSRNFVWDEAKNKHNL